MIFWILSFSVILLRHFVQFFRTKFLLCKEWTHPCRIQNTCSWISYQQPFRLQIHGCSHKYQFTVWTVHYFCYQCIIHKTICGICHQIQLLSFIGNSFIRIWDSGFSTYSNLCIIYSLSHNSSNAEPKCQILKVESSLYHCLNVTNLTSVQPVLSVWF